jgi:hypothetical protein
VIKRIAVVDTSNRQDSKSRADSLLDRLSKECPPEDAPLGLSWEVVQCSPDDVRDHIDDFWLIWAHDSTSGNDLPATLEATVSQEIRGTNVQPALIVCYGGGFIRYNFPPKNPTGAQLAVAERMIRTHEVDGQEVINFHQKPGNKWNLEGFLRSAADSYPRIDKTNLLSILCGLSERRLPSYKEIAHSVLTISRILEGEMMQGLDGCLSARESFLRKSPTVIRALDGLIEGGNGIDVPAPQLSTFQKVMEDLREIRQHVYGLRTSDDWTSPSSDDAEILLKSVTDACRSLRSSD